jgi:hypothetical protein
MIRCTKETNPPSRMGGITMRAGLAGVAGLLRRNNARRRLRAGGSN